MNTLRRCSCLVALTLASLSPAMAGVNSWTLNGPGGGVATAVAVHPTQPQVMLVSVGNGLYRSADGGATWTHAGDANQAVGIAFDPTNPDRVIAASYAGQVYRSENAGRTFTTAARPGTPHRIAMSADGTVYLGDWQSHVYKSTDLGATWTELAVAWPFTDEAITAIAADPQDAAVLYVAVKGVGTFKSSNAGASWGSAIVNGPGLAISSRVFSIAVQPGDSTRVLAGATDGIYVSSNGGADWSVAAGGEWYAFGFDPAAPDNVIALSTFGQIERSLDGGLTWPPTERGPFVRAVREGGIAISAAGKVLAAVADGPMISTDGGDTFAPSVTGIHAEHFYSAATANDGTLYVALSPGPFGVYKRSGASWTALNNDALLALMPSLAFVTRVAVAPGDSRRLCVLGIFDALICSGDGGATWADPPLQFLSTGISISNVVFDPVDPAVVYLSTETAGVWKRETAGGAFVQRSTGLPARVRALAIDPSDPQVLYVGGFFSTGNGVFKSTNGGQTWTPTGALPDEAVLDLAIDPANPERIYAELHRSFYKSENGGVTWTPMNFSPAASLPLRNLYIDPALPSTLLAGSAPEFLGFSRSVDAGATWQHIQWEELHFSYGTNEGFAFDAITGTVVSGGLGTGLHEYQIATDLGVEATGLGALALSASGTFNVVTTNHGTFHAAAPELEITVPANLTITTPSNCIATPGVLRCTLPAIRAGEGHTLAIAYAASGTASLETGSVRVAAREHDLVASNDSQALTAQVRPTVALSVSSTATAATTVNSTITFTATVRNAGPNEAAATDFSLTIPAGATVQSVSPAAPTCNTTGATLVCALGTLASNASVNVTVTAVAPNPATLTWTASTSSTAHNTSSATQATSITTVSAPAPPPTSGGKGGGGGLDWIGLGLLGAIFVRRRAQRADRA
jgi:uncharacterized repeat protein (TIGR01451 family)